jgi:AraC-like DNA-binding protein
MHPLARLSPFIRLAHHFPAGPDWRIQPRVIFDHLLLYTRDGHGRLTVGEEVHRIGPRTLFVVPPGVLHETTHDPGSPNLMYNLHFDFIEEPDSASVPVNLATPEETLARTEWLRAPFAGDDRLRLPTRIEGFAPALYETLFFTILGCARSRAPADLLQAKGAMLQLLAHLYQAHSYTGHRGTASAASLQRLDQMPAHIEERLADELSVGALAAQCNMSETHFRRSFRARFGRSPADYIVQCRLARARHLLVYENLPICRIAEMTGYQSVHYFTRAFAAAFGEPPAAYRARRSA